jgi:hypothetical protein
MLCRDWGEKDCYCANKRRFEYFKKQMSLHDMKRTGES